MFQQTATFACPNVNSDSLGSRRGPKQKPACRAHTFSGWALVMASKKSERLVVRLSPEDRALLERVAAADELEVSTWVRRTALQAARRTESESTPGISERSRDKTESRDG
jgi:hypothetical protein